SRRLVRAGDGAYRQDILRAGAGYQLARAFAQKVQDLLHLHGRGVLRLVQDDEGIRERPATHEGQRRDLDPLFLDQLLHLLGGQEVVQRVVERLHVRIDLLLHVAGQEAEPFAGLDGRAAEDDTVDVAADHHRHAHRNREIGLARARRADPEGEFVGKEVLDIGLLRFGPRLPLLLAGADLVATAREPLELLVKARRVEPPALAHANRAVDLAGVDGPPGLKPGVEIGQDIRRPG